MSPPLGLLDFGSLNSVRVKAPFLAEAEGDPNSNQEPLPVQPALIELAAAAVAHFVSIGS
jgi:hypothetical protein